MYKSHSHSGSVLITFTIVTIIILGAGGFVAVFGEGIYRSNYVSAEQVMLAVLSDSQNVDSLEFTQTGEITFDPDYAAQLDSTLNQTRDNQDLQITASYSGGLYYPEDLLDNSYGEFSLSSNLDLSDILTDEALDVSAQYRIIDERGFAQFQFPETEIDEVNTFNNTWYEIPQEEIKAFDQEFQQETTNIFEKEEELIQAYQDYPFLEIADRNDDDVVNGTEVYTYTMEVDMAKSEQFVQEVEAIMEEESSSSQSGLTPEELLGSLSDIAQSTSEDQKNSSQQSNSDGTAIAVSDNVSMTLSMTKDSFQMKQATLDMEVTNPQESVVVGNASYTLDIDSYNQEPDIRFPENPQSPETFQEDIETLITGLIFGGSLNSMEESQQVPNNSFSEPSQEIPAPENVPELTPEEKQQLEEDLQQLEQLEGEF